MVSAEGNIMSARVIQLTSIYMQQGLGAIAARAKAERRVKFEREVDAIKTNIAPKRAIL